MSRRKIHYYPPNPPITKAGDLGVMCKKDFSQMILLKTIRVPNRIFGEHEGTRTRLKPSPTDIFATTDHVCVTCQKCRKLMETSLHGA